MRYGKIESIFLLYILILILAVVAIVSAILCARQKTKLEFYQKDAERLKEEFKEKESYLKKEALVAAREQLHSDRQKLDDEIRQRRSEINRLENSLSKREDSLEDKVQKVTDKEFELNKKYDELLDKEDYLAELVAKQLNELERVSSMSREEAKNMLLEQIKQELAQEQIQLIRENEQKIKETAEEKSREILSQVMQKCVIDQVIESTVSVVSLPNDEMKGRIIGREGRNIRTLETLTGVDLIIDDTPEAVVLSSFDPVRREVAKLTIEKLIQDGRIHPVRIEEVYEKSKKEIEN